MLWKNATESLYSLQDWVMNNLDMIQYDSDSRYFDFLNYMYQHLHIKEDESTGQPKVIQTVWDEQTELRFLNFKASLDEQATRLGLPTISTFRKDKD